MPFPVDIEYVSRAQRTLNVVFPPEYLLQLVRENGAELETSVDHWHLFPVYDDSDCKRMKRTCNDVVRETRKLRELDWFPQTAVAVGENGGGDYLVFLPDKEYAQQLRPVLYCWESVSGEINEIGNTADLFAVN